MPEKIDKDGIYSLPMNEYHGQPCAGPSISSSGLRIIFQKSPAHYFVHSPLNPKRIARPDSAHFILGRAAHHLLLGEDGFSTEFIGRPETIDGAAWQGNRLACKQWLADQQAAGRTVLTPTQLEQIRGMASALSASPLVNSGILNGEIEQSLIYLDKQNGVWLQSRPDAIPMHGGFADLKTTSSMGEDLDREISRYRYDLQAALCRRAARHALGLEMESFSFVFVETDPPHSVDVLSLSLEDIEAADHDLEAAIETFSWCVRTGNWFTHSGVEQRERFAQLPQFARERAEYRRDFLRREIAHPAPPPIA